MAQTAQIALFTNKKITIVAEYADFINIFSKKSAKILLEPIDITEFAIKLEKNKQQSYEQIYRLRPVELKIYKTYIVIKLAHDFILSFILLVPNFLSSKNQL